MLTTSFVALSLAIPSGASVTGAAAESSDGVLAATGYATPLLLIWVAFGLLALGAAFVLLRTTVRRSRTA
ncbi:hypothetical protein JF66_15480 [Cryobacterium sp. MLB-32]|uniref:hypothetical protein n=1 Tax=Cryobacterium sp. MLB-32 TaxID=1529318 RepID=UPI0004E63850|nr:hypothetical protein [Cryobacterium sp. MLB-32]KFF58853.1 hypothetical protein JF66_15480 [Cryobacterium sp. MLB-32]